MSTSFHISSSDITQTIVAFHAIGAAATLVFVGLTARFVHCKGGRVPKSLLRWTLLCCLLAWLLYFLFMVTTYALSIGSMHGGPLSKFINIYSPVFVQLFLRSAVPLTFYIFYSFIHLALEKTADSERPWRRTRILHWGFSGVVALMSCLTFCLTCAFYGFANGHGGYQKADKLAPTVDYVLSATDIVTWVASTEQMAWMIYLIVKHPKCFGGHSSPIIFLLLANIFWCGSNFLVAVSDISTNLVNTSEDYLNNTDADYTNSIIIPAVFTVMSILAMTLYWTWTLAFCFRLAKLHLTEEGEQSDNTYSKDSGPDNTPFHHEADSRPFQAVAELEGARNQVLETEGNPLAEAEACPRFELPDTQLKH